MISKLIKGISNVPGIGPEKIINLVNSGVYTPLTDSHIIEESRIVIIAVPTPLNLSLKPDLSYLAKACQIISDHAKEGTLIVNESTSFPGTLRNVIKPAIESANSNEFLYASAPERIDPGNMIWTLGNTPRVIAGLTHQATQLAFEFYSSFCKTIHKASSVEVAEASKLFENTYRQVNIALANEFSEIAQSLGFSTIDAIEAAGTKPFGFSAFYPGIGVGGHCIPVDPSYLTYAAELAGASTKIINLANEINLSVHTRVAKRIINFMQGSVKGIKIQIAGITYKVNVADLRESPALLLMSELKRYGAEVSWHDPLVLDLEGNKSEPLRSDIDLGLIVSPHDSIDFTTWKSSKLKVLDLSASAINYGWTKFL